MIDDSSGAVSSLSSMSLLSLSSSDVIATTVTPAPAPSEAASPSLPSAPLASSAGPLVGDGEILLGLAASLWTVLATLRATSRLSHLVQQRGQMGVVDGPLILGPNDILAAARRKRQEQLYRSRKRRRRRRRQLEMRQVDKQQQKEEGPLEVSPLWEATEGFRRAVRQTLRFHRQLAAGGRGGATLVEPEPQLHNQSDDHDTDMAATDRQPSLLHFNWTMDSATTQLFNYTQLIAKSYNSSASPSDAPPADPKRLFYTATAYAPLAFSNLRTLFGISDEEYAISVLNTGPFVSFQSNSRGAARSGGFFFFTRDGAYMIKTVKNEEARLLRKILPRYCQHMKEHAKSSLLTRFCGMYQVSITEQEVDEDDQHKGEDGDPPKPINDNLFGVPLFRKQKKETPPDTDLTFVVMNYVFPPDASYMLSERFDLKGSTVGRICDDEEIERKGTMAIKKDQNLAREVSLLETLQEDSGRSVRRIGSLGIGLGKGTKERLMSQLRKDVEFLQECQVMDYSLLVGVVDLDDRAERAATRAAHVDEHGVTSNSSPRGFWDSLPSRMKSLVSSSGILMLRNLSQHPESVPYHGAGKCGVYGGDLSIVPGSRLGHKAVYYLGLIDFLQPWSTKKVMERDLKRMLGYDVQEVSCAPPDLYASRFLRFLDKYIS